MFAPWFKRRFLPLRFWLELSFEWRLAVFVALVTLPLVVIRVGKILLFEEIITERAYWITGFGSVVGFLVLVVILRVRGFGD